MAKAELELLRSRYRGIMPIRRGKVEVPGEDLGKIHDDLRPFPACPYVSNRLSLRTPATRATRRSTGTSSRAPVHCSPSRAASTMSWGSVGTPVWSSPVRVVMEFQLVWRFSRLKSMCGRNAWTIWMARSLATPRAFSTSWNVRPLPNVPTIGAGGAAGEAGGAAAGGGERAENGPQRTRRRRAAPGRPNRLRAISSGGAVAAVGPRLAVGSVFVGQGGSRADAAPFGVGVCQPSSPSRAVVSWPIPRRRTRSKRRSAGTPRKSPDRTGRSAARGRQSSARWSQSRIWTIISTSTGMSSGS